jgi:hypothetical protein
MKISKTLAAISFAATLCLTSACAHHDTMASNSSTTSGEIRPDAATTGAVPGPAVTDRSGNVYVSSAAGGVGNPATVGTNTNVNITPQRSKSTVVVTESTPVVTETTTLNTTTVDTTPVVTNTTVETTPVVTTQTVTETPAVVETPSMTSSSTIDQTDTTTTTTTTTHRKLHKE